MFNIINYNLDIEQPPYFEYIFFLSFKLFILSYTCNTQFYVVNLTFYDIYFSFLRSYSIHKVKIK